MRLFLCYVIQRGFGAALASAVGVTLYIMPSINSPSTRISELPNGRAEETSMMSFAM